MERKSWKAAGASWELAELRLADQVLSIRLMNNECPSVVWVRIDDGKWMVDGVVGRRKKRRKRESNLGRRRYMENCARRLRVFGVLES